MIERVSLDVVRETADTRVAYRGSKEHLMALKSELLERYPANKNVNVSLGTLQTYFDEFYMPSNYTSYEDLDDERLLLFLESETSYWPSLDGCIDALKKNNADLWDALAVKRRASPISPLLARHHLVKKIRLIFSLFVKSRRRVDNQIATAQNHMVSPTQISHTRARATRRRSGARHFSN